DHVGAQLLWQAWDYKRPSKLKLADGQEEIFKRIETAGKLEFPRARKQHFGWVTALGFGILHFLEHMRGFVQLIGSVVQDAARFAANPVRGPWREISANIFHAGF